MSENFSMIQWKVPVSSVPEEVYHTVIRHMKRLQSTLDHFPTDSAKSLREGEIAAMDSIPAVVKEMKVVRNMLLEVDAILENGMSMLAGYYSHMTSPPEENLEQNLEGETNDASEPETDPA